MNSELDELALAMYRRLEERVLRQLKGTRLKRERNKENEVEEGELLYLERKGVKKVKGGVLNEITLTH